MAGQCNHLPLHVTGSVLLAGIALAGCTLTLSPKDYSLPRETIPSVRVAEPFAVRGGVVGSQSRTISLILNDVKIRYQEFTDAAVRHLQQELERQGIQTVPDAARYIELTIMYVDILRSAGSFACILDYRVTTGDGVVRGLQARDWSWNYEKACHAAVAMVSAETLLDPWVKSYLTGQPSPEDSLRDQADPHSVEARLRELQRLRDQGLVTGDEYEAKRKEILDGL